ncbi:hypothetical protein D3C86_1915150 [compost metagenome]
MALGVGMLESVGATMPYFFWYSRTYADLYALEKPEDNLANSMATWPNVVGSS